MKENQQVSIPCGPQQRSLDLIIHFLFPNKRAEFIAESCACLLLLSSLGTDLTSCSFPHWLRTVNLSFAINVVFIVGVSI